MTDSGLESPVLLPSSKAAFSEGVKEEVDGAPGVPGGDLVWDLSWST
jgi:hypothetical protein